MTTHQRLFDTAERETWATRAGLLAEETFLIETTLDPAARTLEAGTGGGRILLEMDRLGFRDLAGFDYVPALIEAARARDPKGHIDFRVADATAPDYPDAAFDQLLYLQQLLCVVGEAAVRDTVVAEAFRMLRPGGRAVFSFLILEARQFGFFYRRYRDYLRVLRRFLGRDRPLASQPWLKRAGRPNLGALLDRPPYVHWFTIPEALALLERGGFAIKRAGTSSQLKNGTMPPPGPAVRATEVYDKLYVVCGKD